MSKLSPASKAVLDAANTAYDDAATVAQGTAAALRAAADQVVPMALCVYNDDFAHVRHQLHAIADELDAHLGQTR